MSSKAININEYGQITIPKDFRKILNSRTVLLQKDSKNDNIIKLVPIPDIAGSLANYSKKEFIDFSDARNKAWNSEIDTEFNKG